jgi:hypothetical protein
MIRKAWKDTRCLYLKNKDLNVGLNLIPGAKQHKLRLNPWWRADLVAPIVPSAFTFKICAPSI